MYEYEIVSLGMKGGCGWLGLLFLLGVHSKQSRLCHVPRPTRAERPTGEALLARKRGMGGAWRRWFCSCSSLSDCQTLPQHRFRQEGESHCMSQHLSSASNKGREISREGTSLCVRCVPGDASADLIAVVGGGGQQCVSQHLSPATNKGKRSLPGWMSPCLR